MNVDLARVLCALFRGCLSLLMFNGEIVAQNNIFWDNDSSFLAFEQKICEASDDSLNKLKAYYEYGEFLDEAEKYELAIPKFVEALRIAKNIKNHAEIATVANYLANVYRITSYNVCYTKLLRSAIWNGLSQRWLWGASIHEKWCS